MTTPTIPTPRRQIVDCVGCGTPVPNLLTDTCGAPACVALSNALDALENRDDH